MKFLLLAVVTLVQLLSPEVEALKILGGYTDVWDRPTKVHYGRYFEWGLTDVDHGVEIKNVDDPGVNTDIMASHGYCWNHFSNDGGYCYQKLVVSTEDDPTLEHYEILSTTQEIIATYSPDAEDYGPQFIGSDETNITVASGHAWNPETGERGYGYVNYTVKKTTRPGALDATSLQAHSADDDSLSEEETFGGSTLPTSKRVRVGNFNSWTNSWGPDSKLYFYIWVAQTTLVSYSPKYSNQETIETTDTEKLSPMILENHGSGLSNIDMPRLINTEQITTTSTARFPSGFDFPFNAPEDFIINFKAYRASGNVGYLTSFEFPSVADIQNPVSSSQTVAIAWPISCDPGFRVTYNVVEHTEQQNVPIDFKFERSGEQWTETINAKVSLKWTDIHSNDCCLYEYASPACGTEKLPICE